MSMLLLHLRKVTKITKITMSWLLERQLAYMNDFGALLGTTTGMAFSLLYTIPRVAWCTPVRIVLLFVFAVPPREGREWPKLPNADMTGRPCQYSV